MEFTLEKYHLKSFSLFDFLSQDDKDLIKSKLIRMNYLKGEILFKENSYSKGVYLVKKGKVKIFQSNAEGKISIVYIYKKGDYFGYRPILAEDPHPVSAAAMDEVTITFIPGELFSDILKRSSQLAEKLLRVLSKEFSVWINKMTIFSRYAVKERVALSLLILNKVYQRSDLANKTVIISINRDDFAGFVGIAKETLVRMLRIFKDENIISTKGTKIIILKQQALIKMVGDI